jgi:hypothetical protein
MQALLLAIATELAVLLALLLTALGCVWWARRGRLDPARECVRCAYPRGADPQAPCTECGLIPVPGERPRALPTRRWWALAVASGCAFLAVFLAVGLVRRPHFYPMSVHRSSVWSYRFSVPQEAPWTVRVECQARGAQMGYELFSNGSAMSQTPVRVVLLTFSVLAPGEAVRATLPLARAADGWTLQMKLPGEGADDLPAPGTPMDDATVARWLAARLAGSGPDAGPQSLLIARWFMTEPGLEDRIFGGGPLSGDGQSGLEAPAAFQTGRTGSNFVGGLDRGWSALRDALTLLVALALGGWAVLLAVRTEQSRRIMSAARG